jgi:hypothetical protein
MLSLLFARELAAHRIERGVCGNEDLIARLSLDATLRFHRGCVNTVHFNRTGSLLVRPSRGQLAGDPCARPRCVQLLGLNTERPTSGLWQR